MTEPIYVSFSAGSFTAGYLVVALFFLKFWRRTRDSLFAGFSVAFLLLAIQAALPALLDVPEETQTPFYLLRLLAFGIIICAIILKNLKA